MNIGQLIDSTNTMGKGRTLSDCLTKKLGTVYAGNKEVIYKTSSRENNCIVEISMYIGAETQEDRNLHKVSIALKGMPADKCDTYYLVKWIKERKDLSELLDNNVLTNVLRKSYQDLRVSSMLNDDESVREFLSYYKENPTIEDVRSYRNRERRKQYKGSVGEEEKAFKNVSYYSDLQKVKSIFNNYGKRDSFKDKNGEFDEKAFFAFQSHVVKSYKEEFSESYTNLVRQNELRGRDEFLSGYNKAKKLNKRYNSLSIIDKAFVDSYSSFETVLNNNIDDLDINNYTTTTFRRLMTQKEVESYAEDMSVYGEMSAEKEILEYIKQGYYIDIDNRKIMKSLIPEEYIVDLVKYNPYIVDGFIIIQEDAKDGWVIIKNYIDMQTEIRVNCSCFTGDTRVQLANGTTLTLKDLENMTDFKVLAYNTETGNYEYARALNCTKRQENTKIMKVTLADGTSIRVTPSHRFLNSNCEWKQAQDLKVGDLLKFNYKYWGYKNHEQHTSSSTFIYLDPTQEGDYQFGELKFTHKPFYIGITTGAYVKIENERCLDYLNDLADKGVQPLMFKQYYHVDEHVALQLKEKLVNRIGTIDNGSVLVNNPVQVNDNFINENDDCISVTSIEELEEREDVYCLTVEGLGNFALKTEKGNIIVENCADYEYTYAWYNYENKAHIYNNNRKPIRYYTNNGIILEPKRNPNKLPGMCKHLVVFLSILLDEGIVNTRDSKIQKTAENFITKRGGILEYRNIDLRDKIKKLESKMKSYKDKLHDQLKEQNPYKSEDFVMKKFDMDFNWGADYISNYKVPLDKSQKELAEASLMDKREQFGTGTNIVKNLLKEYSDYKYRSSKTFGQEIHTPKYINKIRKNKWKK